MPKTLSKMKKFYWYQFPLDTINYVRECPECQLASQKYRKVQLQSRWTTKSFEILSVDLCGPLKHNERGYQYVANFIDCFTKFIVSVPVKTA